MLQELAYKRLVSWWEETACRIVGDLELQLARVVTSGGSAGRRAVVAALDEAQVAEDGVLVSSLQDTVVRAVSDVLLGK